MTASRNLRLVRTPWRVRDERGAALLMAMVIVTLVATLSASMVWQQWRAVQVEAAERVRSQAGWVLSGAQDWARMILREDQRNGGPDHLGEPWAIPLAEARLSTFLAADAANNARAGEQDDAPEAFLSGKVEDASARYNLHNLVNDQGDVVPEELAVFRRLCEAAGLSPALADGVANSLRQASLATKSGDASALDKLGGDEGRNKAPLLPRSVSELTWLGLDAGTVERLRPFITLLPDASRVNVNTASKEVIAAAVDGLDLARASRIVQERQRNPFKTVDAITAILGAGRWNVDRLAVTSDFFEVSGRLRMDDNVIEQRQLLQRVGADVLVRQQSRFSGLESSSGMTATP
ncbi:MAG: type II secretion system minor pseudopilin GspK [Aquabacterium sp.]|uniref:type II secretion system minor pseudopilin GspK n=1 Tax=Aquabacterium sp. TaxID=1872578 RepID=UPI003BC16CE3